jgi:MerR family transcriptional regulator, light-induced transcriptional regulator
VRTLKTSEAAALLGVSPNTLRTWERRFGFPRAMRSPHQHRRYAYAEVIALHGALQRGLSISSAVSLAANGLNADSDALVTALSAFRGDVADEAVEASLALRSVERTINDVVLASLNELRAEYGVSSASWAFAADWAVDWFRRAERFGAARHQRTSVLVGDAAGAWTDPARLYIAALKLSCVRLGATVLSLPVDATLRIRDVAASVNPDIAIIAGNDAGDEVVARWAYAVQMAAEPMCFLLYLRGPGAMNPDTHARLLPISPTDAGRDIMRIAATDDDARRGPLMLAQSANPRGPQT